MSHVAWSLCTCACVCLSVTITNPAKTEEPIELSFVEEGTIRVDQRNHLTLDGDSGTSDRERGTLGADMIVPTHCLSKNIAQFGCAQERSGDAGCCYHYCSHM